MVRTSARVAQLDFCLKVGLCRSEIESCLVTGGKLFDGQFHRHCPRQKRFVELPQFNRPAYSQLLIVHIRSDCHRSSNKGPRSYLLKTQIVLVPFMHRSAPANASRMGMQQDQQMTKIKQRSDPTSLANPIVEVTVLMLGRQPDMSSPHGLCRQTEQPG